MTYFRLELSHPRPSPLNAASVSRVSKPESRRSENAPDTFWRDEAGAGTMWWTLWMIIFLVFGGVAVDSSSAWRMRAQLQFTADAAAHAGVIDLPDEAAAIAGALGFASANMASADHGDVLTNSDIEIGVWNSVSNEFEPSAPSDPLSDAIRVTTRRDQINSNKLKAYFLRLIGMAGWDVNAQAVAQRYVPECLHGDAIIAGKIVDLQSNNTFQPGICIHGNGHVEVNNGNTWEPGVSVTMPDLADLVTPSSDLETQNAGLVDALGEEWFLPKIVSQVPEIIDSLLDPAGPYTPSYIGFDGAGDPIPPANIVVTSSSAGFSAASMQQGHIYHVTCANPNGLLNLGAGVEVSKAVLVTNCRLYTGANSYFHDVILASTAFDSTGVTFPKSINIGQGNQFGANDACDPGGNVQVIAKNSIHGAASMSAYGAQFVAMGDVELAAQAGGMQGIQILAGQDASITSNNAFGGGCPVVGGIQVPYFRLVR